MADLARRLLTHPSTAHKAFVPSPIAQPSADAVSARQLPNDGANALWLIGAPLLFYLAWQVLYWLVVQARTDGSA